MRSSATHGTDPEVVVIGAGPSGLFAAAELARHGVVARVLDRLPAPHHQTRATAIQPGTLELLARAGLVEDVLAATLVVAPGRVAVDVVDGVVTLTGELDTHGDAEVAVEMARRVEGVVDVVDELTWQVPDRPETIPVRDLLH